MHIHTFPEIFEKMRESCQASRPSGTKEREYHFFTHILPAVGYCTATTLDHHAVQGPPS